MTFLSSVFSGKKKFYIAGILAALAVAAALAALVPMLLADERADDPEKYTRLALSNLYTSMDFQNALSYDSGWLFEILGGRHKLELGLALRDIDLPLPLDYNLISMAQLAELDADITRDTAAAELSGSVNLGVSGAPVIGADIYMSEEELAFRLPQGADYFITLDPRHATEEAGGSVLGNVLALPALPWEETDRAFYGAYSRAFAPATQPGKLTLVNDTERLFADAEYGLDEVADKDGGVYRYTMVLKRDSFNTWYNSLAGSIESYSLFRAMGADMSWLYGFSVTGDVRLALTVRNDAVEHVRFDTLLYNGVKCSGTAERMNESGSPLDGMAVNLRLENPNGVAPEPLERFDAAGVIAPYVMIERMPPLVDIAVKLNGTSGQPGVIDRKASAEFTAGGDTAAVSCYLFWDNTGGAVDNFKLQADMSARSGGGDGKASLNVSGTVLEARDKGELFTDFGDISWNFTDFDGSEQALGLRMSLNLKSAGDAAIGYDAGGAVKLTEMTPLQLMQIYAKLKADPVVGGFIPE